MQKKNRKLMRRCVAEATIPEEIPIINADGAATSIPCSIPDVVAAIPLETTRLTYLQKENPRATFTDVTDTQLVFAVGQNVTIRPFVQHYPATRYAATELSFAASPEGMPPGLCLDLDTGLITGTPLSARSRSECVVTVWANTSKKWSDQNREGSTSLACCSLSLRVVDLREQVVSWASEGSDENEMIVTYSAPE